MAVDYGYMYGFRDAHIVTTESRRLPLSAAHLDARWSNMLLPIRTMQQTYQHGSRIPSSALWEYPLYFNVFILFRLLNEGVAGRGHKLDRAR